MENYFNKGEPPGTFSISQADNTQGHPHFTINATNGQLRYASNVSVGTRSTVKVTVTNVQGSISHTFKYYKLI